MNALFFLALVAAGSANAAGIQDLADCYSGLIPALGVKRMHIGKAKTIFAEGTRAGTRGFYTFEAGKTFFHALPTMNTAAEVATYKTSMERYNAADGNQRIVYHLTVKSGGEDTDVTFERGAFYPLTWIGSGTQINFVREKGRTDRPAHVAPPKSDEILPPGDADALAALAQGLTSLVSAIPQRLNYDAGIQAALKRAVDACLVNFPKGTGVGDALLACKQEAYPAHAAGARSTGTGHR